MLQYWVNAAIDDETTLVRCFTAPDSAEAIERMMTYLALEFEVASPVG